MTRLFCALLCLGLGTASAQTLNYETPAPTEQTTLTFQNLMWAAFHLDQTAEPSVRAAEYLNELEPQRYASNMHDAEALAAEARIVESEISEQLSKIDPRLRYVIDMTGLVREVKGSEAFVTSRFDIGTYDMETRFSTNSRYFPPRYDLLIANADNFSHFKLPRGVAAEFANLIDHTGPQPAYLRIEIELVSLHQGHAFQSVIRNVKWFRDVERSKLLSENSDTRDAAAVIKTRMLSEGITFDAPPDHAYVVADERMLETLVQNYPRKERTCEEQPRENGHRVFLCQIERVFLGRFRSRAEYLYVGGRLAQVEMFNIDEALTDAQRANIWHMAQHKHMGPSVPRKTGPTEWSFGRSAFFYDPAPTYNARDPKPYYRAVGLRYLDLKAGKPGNEVKP